jgi:hypothetical protein
LDRRGFRVRELVVVVEDVPGVVAVGGGVRSAGDEAEELVVDCVVVVAVVVLVVVVVDVDVTAAELSRTGVVAPTAGDDDDDEEEGADVTVIDTAVDTVVVVSTAGSSFFVGEALMRTRAGNDCISDCGPPPARVAFDEDDDCSSDK